MTRSEKRSKPILQVVPLVAILLAAFALRTVYLTADRFHADEALYAGWALRILDDDPLLLSEPVDKPPLYLYVLAGSLRLFGPSEVAARFPSLAASMVGIALLYHIGRRIYGRTTGTWAALLLALSPFDILFARTAFTDSLLVLWILCALCAAIRGHWTWTGFYLGLAQATKQHALLLIPLVLAAGAVWWLSVPHRKQRALDQGTGSPLRLALRGSPDSHLDPGARKPSYPAPRGSPDPRLDPSAGEPSPPAPRWSPDPRLDPDAPEPSLSAPRGSPDPHLDPDTPEPVRPLFTSADPFGPAPMESPPPRLGAEQPWRSAPAPLAESQFTYLPRTTPKGSPTPFGVDNSSHTGRTRNALSVSTPAARPHGIHTLLPAARPLLVPVLAFALPYALVIAWDSARWTIRPGYWQQSVMSYGYLSGAPFAEWGQRLVEWLLWARYLTGSPVLNALLVGGIVALVIHALRHPLPRTRIDVLFAAYGLTYLLGYTVLQFSIWDRYLLPLAPLTALLLARTVAFGSRWLVERTGALPQNRASRVLIPVLVLLAAIPAGGRAAGNGYPVGGEHWAYQGLDQIAAYLKEHAPPDAVLYHHWLRWHYTYYLHGTDLELRWWESGQHLRREAARTPDRTQYIVLPDWRTLEPDAEGIRLVPIYETRRRDGSVSLRLYRIELES